jgi:hypothetical protein
LRWWWRAEIRDFKIVDECSKEEVGREEEVIGLNGGVEGHSAKKLGSKLGQNLGTGLLQ